MCAAHSHSIYGRTWCSLGRKLDSLTQDSCAFHDDHVVYESFNGVVLAEKEGKDIAKCLGDRKAALLINHGLLTVGKTIEEVSTTPTYQSWPDRILMRSRCRPSSGSSRWTSAARASSWLKQRPALAARSPLRLAMKRRLIHIGLLARPLLGGSARSRCSMSSTRRPRESTWSKLIVLGVCICVHDMTF